MAENTTDSMSTHDVIMRLRKIKAVDAVHAKEMFKDGVMHGEEWAKRLAHPDQLARIQQLRDETDDDDWDALTFPDDEGADPTAYLGSFINTGKSGSSSFPQFWNSALQTGSGPASDLNTTNRFSRDRQFLRGFVLGALKVWSEVAAAVNASEDPPV